MTLKSLMLAGLLALVSAQTMASTTLEAVQKRWAEVNYTMQDKAQEQAFEDLLNEVKQWINEHPENADAYIWQGIIQSTYAGAKGGLGALGLAKDARASLEHALELQADALQGSAYASLGTLYFKVPGWPLGFGDDEKAKELLEKALEFNPHGIDPNYFYADYLYEQKDYRAAKVAAEKALAAAPRPERPLADAERRKEVEALYQKIMKKVR